MVLVFHHHQGFREPGRVVLERLADKLGVDALGEARRQSPQGEANQANPGKRANVRGVRATGRVLYLRTIRRRMKSVAPIPMPPNSGKSAVLMMRWWEHGGVIKMSA